MQKNQEIKIKMSRAVSGILTGSEDVVSRTPGLADARNELDKLIEKTEQHNQGQLKTGKELTLAKNEARSMLTTNLISICAALAAFGTTTTDPAAKIMKTKYQIKDSEVKRKRDMPLFTFAYTVYGDAMPYSTQLEPFVTAEDVLNLKTLADNYNNLLPKKRTQQSLSTLSTQNLEEVMSQIDLLLKDTIDVLVKPWEFKEPDFYNAYKNARVIVEVSSRKSAKTDEPAPAQ